jgi:hypothetical protein
MTTRNALLICGTLSQTKAMLAIGAELSDFHCYYTPFYGDGVLRWAGERGWMNFTPMGGPLRERAMRHLRQAGVRIDDRGEGRWYDLVVTCTDLVIQENIRAKRIVLVQEGLTEPEGPLYLGVKHLGLPRYLANTAAFGMSHAYGVFCVASPGYRDLFLAKGVAADKMVVTGIPNFDNPRALIDNDFPHRDFVLVCTSNARETFKWDNRARFLRQALRIADGRRVIIKLHPAERHGRAEREARMIAPEAIVLHEGNTEHMIANAAAVIAQYSTVAFTAAALGKEVHSYVPPELIRRVLPIQNEGTSARNIAETCRRYLASGPPAMWATPVEFQQTAFHAPDLTHVRLMPR